VRCRAHWRRSQQQGDRATGRRQDQASRRTDSVSGRTRTSEANQIGLTIGIVEADTVDLDEVLARTFSLIGPHLTYSTSPPTLGDASANTTCRARRGGPASPPRELAGALTAAGHPVGDDNVGRLLKQPGYRLQARSRPWRTPRIPTGTPSPATSRSRLSSAVTGCSSASPPAPTKRLVRQFERLGHKVTLEPADAA
jgi:hypothetical protein